MDYLPHLLAHLDRRQCRDSAAHRALAETLTNLGLDKLDRIGYSVGARKGSRAIIIRIEECHAQPLAG